jgi:hypothetical protein
VHSILSVSVAIALLVPAPRLGGHVQPSSAWFDLGHRLVVEIAESRLTDQTKSAVRDLLSGQPTADAALWADRIRGQRRNTSPYHFVNIPLWANAYDPRRDCPENQCIIPVIDSFERVLADTAASRNDRAEALRFLLHLIGDLHQPLHVADNGDKGGNDTQVRLAERGTNLHKAWDGQMIETLALDEPRYLARLRAKMASLDLASFESGTVIEWAMEGHEIARQLAYRIPEGRRLDSAYVQKALDESDLAIIKAGVRLAAVLNRSLVGYRPAASAAAKAGTYTDAEAIGHVGECATVIGTVVSVHTSKRGNIFLNFGADYPRQTFTVALLTPHGTQPGQLAGLKGRRVKVHGLIRLYQGQPEILVQEASEIAPVE